MGSGRTLPICFTAAAGVGAAGFGSGAIAIAIAIEDAQPSPHAFVGHGPPGEPHATHASQVSMNVQVVPWQQYQPCPTKPVQLLELELLLLLLLELLLLLLTVPPHAV